MEIFNNLFKTKKEKKILEIMKKRPNVLMHTSNEVPANANIIKPVFNKEVNSDTVFATDSEKLALAYSLQPFYSFRFGKDNKEIGLIILGTDHDLLKLDNKKAYIYSVDSSSFTPVVMEDGYYENEWVSPKEVYINKNFIPKEISLNDILSSGVQVFWINNANTLNGIDNEIVNNSITSGDKKIQYLINQTNWKPDKVIYMNRFKNICPIKIDSSGKITY